MLSNEVLLKAYRLMCTARAMGSTFEANRTICKYVHSTSKGHEAIQIAVGLQLMPCDYVSPYYRDDSLLLSMGFSPYDLMLQLLAKADDYFSGGRSYYCHPSSKLFDKPKIIHQSSATGMQAIPTTGVGHGIQFLEKTKSPLLQTGLKNELPVVVCSLGDGSVTEGEVAEAFQFAALKQLPIIYLVQDNDWGISATASETRTMNAYEYADGFKQMKKVRVDGSNFLQCYETMREVINVVRKDRRPVLVHVRVPLLGHHTSGVRKEFYRTEEDLKKHELSDPLPKLKALLKMSGVDDMQTTAIENLTMEAVLADFEKAKAAANPLPASVSEHVFAPAKITEEKGVREPTGATEKIMMVDAALFAIREIMQAHPEAIFFGQDVGKRLGGVFREAATLGEQFGDDRVFNTAIQEAYIIGSTIGLSAVGVKPIVEVQFADYIYPGFNQLVSEMSKSCYLSNGKFPVQSLIRVPIGAYGGGGPYHSGSVESTLLTVKGIKVVYPSNAADMKGLMKAAFADPNPVVMLEHKGLYWSKVPGTEEAKCVEPDADYVIPLGKANIVLEADEEMIDDGESLCVVTYGMGVYWAKAAAQKFPFQIEVIDLRTLFPLDEALVFASVKKHGRVLLLTEEQNNNSFMQAFGMRISHACFRKLDAPVEVMGALDLPAVPINLELETAMLPNAEKVAEKMGMMLRS
jgi:2-oxoisovalerate dehydrogenase E1 component